MFEPRVGTHKGFQPTRLSGGMNLYGYASQNPLSFVDPMGLRDWTVEETEDELRRIGNQSYVQVIINHWPGRKYDFKHNNKLDRFPVNGRMMAADQFGNYAAGYASHRAGGDWGFAGMRVGGGIVDIIDNVFRGQFGNIDLDKDSEFDLFLGWMRSLFEDHEKQKCSKDLERGRR